MRQAARKGAVAISRSVPAPVAGLNTRDPLASLKEDEASILDNWFPTYGRVELRRGHVSHAVSDGVFDTDPVESLLPYEAGSTNKLFAAAGTAIYDATTAGDITSASLSSLTNARWQHAMMSTSGGNYLLIANGADSVRSYDGSAWATPSITGATSSTFIHVNVHKERVWFVPVNSLTVYYLGANAIAGAATAFPLGAVFNLGGYVMAMGTWTRDGGDGVDDLAVFVSNKGEVAIYQGTDPASASTFALVGVFRIAPPIGRRCLIKYGPQLIVVTTEGVGELAQLIRDSRARPSDATTKINPSMTEDAREHGSKYGWQPVFYPRGSMFFVNVPITEEREYRQWVMNTQLKAWCRFTGLNATCWAVFGDELYFGGVGAVYKADTGESDNGANIVADARQANQYFTQGLKAFRMVRPVFQSTTADVRPALEMNVDYDETAPTDTVDTIALSGSFWDDPDWDSADWGNDYVTTAEWQSVDGLGYSGAVRMKVQTRTASIRWLSTDYLFEPGGYV